MFFSDKIINTSLNTGVFPTRLKYSIITPLHEKGDKNEESNYRPFFLLTSFSKIFERIIYNRLLTHFTSNKIFTINQFGFRKKFSTDKAAYKLIDDILVALNNKQGNKTVPAKVVTTCTEDGDKQITKVGTTL